MRGAPARDPWLVVSKLDGMLGEGLDAHAEAARRFADRYAAFDGNRQRRSMFERVTELLAADTTVEPVYHADAAAV